MNGANMWPSARAIAASAAPDSDEGGSLAARISGFLAAGTADRNPQRATSLLLEVVRQAGENVSMPQSNKEKQEAFRARNAMLGLTEVRGVFLPPELHEKLKEAAKKLLRKVPPSRKPAAK